MSFGQQGGSDHRAPTAAAHGVKKSTGQGQGNRFGGFGADGDRLVVGSPENVGPHDDEVDADPGFEFFPGKVGENVRPGDPAENAGNGDFPEESAVNVLVKEMTHPADPRRKNFRNLHTVADHRRSDSQSEKKGRAGDPVSHAQSPVDELADKSHKHGGHKNGHG